MKHYRSDHFQNLHLDPSSAIPLAVQLEQQLTWLIASGELRTSDRLPPVREFAALLKINLHTVRAAYHHLERFGLVSTRPGAGTIVLTYDPAKLAAAASDAPSHTIGVLIPSLHNSLYAPLIHGIEDAAKRTIMVLICDMRDDSSLAERFFHQLIARKVDGVILASTGFNLDPDVREVFPHFVTIDEPVSQTNSIQIDSRRAGYLAARHLIEHGHTRIGLVTAPLDWPNVRLPYLGFCDALRESGLALDPRSVVETPGFTVDFGERGAGRLLKEQPELSAIFGSGDLLAIGAMRAARSLGRSVPGNMAIVGFNNIDLSELVDPPLTTVSIPMYEIGVKAFKMLEQIRRGAHFEKPYIIQPGLVIRQSCGCQAVASSQQILPFVLK